LRGPYVSVPVRMKVSEDDEIQFWWSCVVSYFDASVVFFDYLGLDLGDLRFLWKTLRPGTVFLDVGAHRGVQSILAAKKLSYRGTVLSTAACDYMCNRII
jgi:hypothetical protein